MHQFFPERLITVHEFQFAEGRQDQIFFNFLDLTEGCNRFADCNKPFWRKLMYRAFVRAKRGCDKWHDYEMSVAPYETDKPIYYEFTACPAAEFAIRHGLTDIMPALCNVDYASMELLHAKLVRTTTCVDGCRCDYTICGDKDPYLKGHPEYRDEAGFRRNR